jgi:hypothetical protein
MWYPLRIVLMLCSLLLSACSAPEVGDTTPDPTSLVSPAATLPPVTLVSPIQPSLPSASPQPGLTQTQDIEAGDLADYYGGLIITLDHVGQTITMKPGQGFVLRLGKEFIWQVNVTPVGLLTINRKITPEPGEQGVFVARGKGAALLTAIGSPACLQQEPPCSRPSVLFRLKLDIQ